MLEASKAKSLKLSLQNIKEPGCECAVQVLCLFVFFLFYLSVALQGIIWGVPSV